MKIFSYRELIEELGCIAVVGLIVGLIFGLLPVVGPFVIGSVIYAVMREVGVGDPQMSCTEQIIAMACGAGIMVGVYGTSAFLGGHNLGMLSALFFLLGIAATHLMAEMSREPSETSELAAG